MRNLRLLLGMGIFLTVIAGAQAQTFTTLYDFPGGSNGQWPVGGVIQDPGGNLWGTTYSAGGSANCVYGCGTVYKLVPGSDGWTETVVHGFSGTPDGATPYSELSRDQAGNFYGTTYAGGASNNGTVFKIDSAGNESVLYSFTGRTDGCKPTQGLILEQSGTMFGTASGCGSSNSGTIFQLDSSGNFTLLHYFTGHPDGEGPWLGKLTMDNAGNLYGVTYYGGTHNLGAFYKLRKTGAITVLHSFAGGMSDGCYPIGSVPRDDDGNFYGTTIACGHYFGDTSGGIIWKVNQTGQESVLHKFQGGTSDGCNPGVGVTRDSNGNLYGLASSCGVYSFGTLYEFSATGELTLLHSFDDSNGFAPGGEVLRTRQGILFGTTNRGGLQDNCEGVSCGTAWSYIP